jgi:hypothetical protein
MLTCGEEWLVLGKHVLKQDKTAHSTHKNLEKEVTSSGWAMFSQFSKKKLKYFFTEEVVYHSCHLVRALTEISSHCLCFFLFSKYFSKP